MNEELPDFDDLAETLPSLHELTLVDREAFDAMEKVTMGEGGSLCPGHSGTVIWYVVRWGYVMELRLSGRADLLVEFPCTFTPTFGMDVADVWVAERMEQYLLFKLLGRPMCEADPD